MIMFGDGVSSAFPYLSHTNNLGISTECELHLFVQGDDTLYGGVNENVLIGDYGQVIWINEIGETVARQGGGERLYLPQSYPVFVLMFS